MKVSHTAIAAKNLEESFKFYTEILGFKQVSRFSPQEGMTIVYLKGEGDTMIELIEGADKSALKLGSGTSLLLIGLEVKNMDTAVNELQKKGINFNHGPIDTGEGTKIAFFNDPNGVEIELVQHVKK